MATVKSIQAASALPAKVIPTGTVTVPFKYVGVTTTNTDVLECVKLPAGGVVTDFSFQIKNGKASLTGMPKVTQTGATTDSYNLLQAVATLATGDKEKKKDANKNLPVYTEYSDGAGTVKLPVVSITFADATITSADTITGTVTYTLESSAERFEKATDQ